MTTHTPLVFERHRHGRATEYRFQNWVTSLVTKSDVFGHDTSTVHMLGAWEEAMRMVTVGDYIVQRGADSYATYIGRVVNTASSLERSLGGELSHPPQPIHAVGLWETLKRMQVHVLQTASGAYSVRRGTLFPFTEWAPAMASFIARTPGPDEPPGQLLRDMFRYLAHLKLPDTLGGGMLGDEIAVVYDAETAAMYAPKYSDIDPVDVGRLSPGPVASTMGIRTTSVGSLLDALFLPEHTIMEMFPALVEGGTAPYSALAKKLGRRPVIVYRMKPFRAEALRRAAVAQGAYVSTDFEARMGATDAINNRQPGMSRSAHAQQGQLLGTDGMFSAQTFPPMNMVGIPVDMITRVDRSRSDDNRVNCVNINVTVDGTQTVDSLADIGIPITLPDQIVKHGLRMTYTQWPWFSPNVSGTTPVYYRAIAAQIMQFNMYNHLFDEGTINLFSTDAVVVTEDGAAEQTTFAPALAVSPGDWVRFKLDNADEYYAYVYGVERSLRRLPSGELTAHTVLSFNRGHFANHDSWMQKPEFPMEWK